MRNSVSDVTDAEILDEAREAMTQAAFDAADEANAAQAVESATESLPAFDELGLSDEITYCTYDDQDKSIAETIAHTIEE